jgi:hypothetical protein
MALWKLGWLETRAVFAGALACAAMTAAGCGSEISCGEGTSSVNGACVSDDVAPVFSAITVTHLKVPYDTTQPVYLGHRLPIQLALRADSEAELDEPRSVAVTVALVEHADGVPTDEELAALNQCEVATLHYDLVGGGRDEFFEPILELPKECLPDGRVEADYDIMVFVDVDETAMDADAQRMFAFTDMSYMLGDNPECKSSFEDGAEADGCLHTLHVEPSPGSDIEETVVPDGNIALFWEPAAGSTEEQRAMMTVEINRRAFGSDPYDVVNPDTGETEGRDMLEGILTQRVRIAPASGPHAGDFHDLEVDNEEGEMLSNPTWQRLTANSDNDYAFDLFPTTEVRDLIDTGDWRTEEEFVIEVCLDPSFAEAGEIGSTELADHSGGNILAANNCSRFNVLGVRARPPAAAANELSASTSLSRNIGNDVVGVKVGFESNARVGVGSGVANTEGFADLDAGRFPRIRIAQAKAAARVDLTDPSKSGVALGLDVFGTRVKSFNREVPNSAELFAQDWSFTQRRCVKSRFQIGPVPLGVEGCAQGEVGFEFSVGMAYGDAIEGGAVFDTADAEAQIIADARPYFSVGGSVKVAVDAGIARAGVQGELTLFDYSIPAQGTLNVGFDASDAAFGDTPSAMARLALHVDQDFRGPNGRVSLFADLRRLKWCKRWRIRYPCGLRWSRIATVPLFTFGAARDSRVMYDFTAPDAVLN